MRRRALPFTTGLALALAPTTPAQTQPPEASNAQDEYVYIDANPNDERELSGALTVIRTPDTFADNQYIAQVFELRCAPFEVLPYVRALVTAEGGSASTNEYVDPQGQRRNRLTVVCPPYQMDYVEHIVASFNEEGLRSNPGGLRMHMRAHNRLASELAEILRTTDISTDGVVRADDVTNTVFFLDSESDGTRALSVMRYYDVPPRMVELEVRILEVDVSDTAQLGLDWDAWKNSAAGFVALTAAARDSLGGEFLSFDTLLLTDVTAVAEFLNYLVHTGRATVVTHTSLVAVNGSPAVLESSLRVPYLAYAPELGADPLIAVDDDEDPNDIDGVVVLNEAGRSVLRDTGAQHEGFRLTFTPTIGTESMICDVECVINSVVRQSDLDEPLVAERRTQTVMTLADGVPCLIGTFDQSRSIRVQDGFPLLRHIPYLGQSLFSEWTDEIRRTKMVVLATPRVDRFLQYSGEVLMNGQPVPAPDLGAYAGRPATAPAPEVIEEIDREQTSLEESAAQVRVEGP